MAKKKSIDQPQPFPGFGFVIGQVIIGHSIVWNQIEAIDLEKLQLQVSWEFQGDRASGEINIQLLIKFFLEGNEKVSLMTNNHFKVYSPKILEKEEQDGLPLGFLRTLVNISIGTARGILIPLTANSFWRDYPLPIQNIAEIVPDGTIKHLS